MLSNIIHWLFSRHGRMQERAVRSGVWMMFGAAATRGASVAKVAVLGRLLSPHDFGVMGIAVVLSAWVGYFTETGITAGLIQKRDDIRPYLDTAWTIQVLRSTGVALLLFAIAPLGGWFFATPEATPIIRLIGLNAIIWSLTNPAVVYLRRELDFRREVLWRLSGVSAGVLVAIPLALVWRSYWVLFISAVSAQAVETIASYWVQDYRPHFRFDRLRAIELMRFGKWVFVLNVVTFLTINGDSVAVGRMLGATALGFYQMANQLAMLFTSQIGVYVDAVMFPAFSHVDDERKLAPAFLRTLMLTSVLAVPVACFLSLFARPLVLLALGPKWVPIATALQVLAWAGVARAIGGTTRPLLMAVGKPDLAVRGQILGLAVLAAAVYPLAVPFGLAGIAVAVLMGAVACSAYQMWLVARSIELSAARIGGACGFSLLASVPLLAAGALAPDSISLSFFLLAGAGLLAYAVILLRGLWSRGIIAPGQFTRAAQVDL